VLTGLSTTTLREWTSRRALIPADVPPRTQGSPAKYNWQTILLLRLAVTMRDRFHLELQAHRGLFGSLRAALRQKSFIALWDQALALHGGDDWALVDEANSLPLRDDTLIIRLNPHLLVLSEGFALPNPARAVGQLNLFPATALGDTRGRSAESLNQKTVAERRRKSA
jgi:hypothetical protein